MASFGSEIKRIRLERGYSQEKFARLLDSNQSVISSWERDFRVPPVETIRQVANVLHVPFSSLVQQDGSVTADDASLKIAEALQTNQKLRQLFDRAQYLSDYDLNVLLTVATALSKDRTDDV